MGKSRYEYKYIHLHKKEYLHNEELTINNLLRYGIKTTINKIKENKDKCIYDIIYTGGRGYIKKAKLYSIELCKKYMQTIE